MRRILLGRPITDADFNDWVKRSLREVERSSADAVGPPGSILYGTNAAPVWGTYSATATSVDMNAVADTTIKIVFPAGFTRAMLNTLFVSHASTSLVAATTVQYGVFTGTGGGGATLIAATASTISATAEATNNNMQQIAGSTTLSFNASPIYFRVTTAHGSAATADIALHVRFLP